MNFVIFAVPIRSGKSGFILCLLRHMTSVATDDNVSLFADSSNLTCCFFLNNWNTFVTDVQNSALKHFVAFF